jgi:hypothetical protein
VVEHTPPDDTDEAGSDDAVVDPASAFVAPWPLQLAQVGVFAGAFAGAAGVALAIVFALADRGWAGALLNMLFFGPGLVASAVIGVSAARAAQRLWQRRIAQALLPSTSKALPSTSAPTTSTSTPA